MISIYYQNVNRIRSKLPDYHSAIKATMYDVIVLVETNLIESIDSLEVFGNDYLVFRHDRHTDRSERMDGGGVLIAVRLPRSACEVGLLLDSDQYVEIVAVSIALTNRKMFVLCIYLPHWAHTERRFTSIGSTLSKFMESVSNDDLVMVLGDFNLSNVEWLADLDLPNVYFPSNQLQPVHEILLNSFFECGLFQINDVF